MKRNRWIALLIVIALFIQLVPDGVWSVPRSVVAQSANQLREVTWQDTVRPDKVWEITFSSPVNIQSISSAHIKVFDAQGTEAAVRFRTSLDGLKVFVMPVSDYVPGIYTLKTLDGIEDISGREQTDDISIRFTVDGEPEPDAIVITPALLTLDQGQIARFTAALVGGTSTRPFIWQATGSMAETEFIGSISANGDYQAPMRSGQYYVQVGSEEFPGLHDTAVVVVNEPPAVSVDLAFDTTSLEGLANSTQPGDRIVLKVRVYNQSAAGERIGGSIVRFLINDRIIDEVPFYMKAGQAYQDVNAYYYMPMGEYAGLLDKEEVPARVTAIVDPYGEVRETNEENNSVVSEIMVRYRDDTAINDTNPALSVDATGLSVWSFNEDVLGDRLNAAQPGQSLRLQARINYPSEDAYYENINVKFLVNGIVVLNDNRRPYKPTAGFFEVNWNYQVPFNCMDPIDFRVLLSNGSTAGLSIPVLQHDLSVGPDDLHWSTDIVARPGQHLYLHARLKNMPSISFPTERDRIAWRALIDGKEFAEGDFFVSDNLINVTLPAYDVPAGQTEPILLTIITDVYDQIVESNEANNIATIEIPVLNTGLATPNFYIEPADLSYFDNPILPGSHVTLQAAVHHQGATFPSQSLKVAFKVNGVVLITKTVDHSDLKPFQPYLATYDWIAPPTLSGTPVFEVILDPNFNIAEDDESDNTASIQMQVFKSDLDVTDNPLSWQPQQPVTGTTVKLTAIVKNNGMAPAWDAKVRFFADGKAIGAGDASIEQVPGASAATAVLDWTIPATPPADLPYNSLAGQPDRFALPKDLTRNYQLTVQADPGDAIMEVSESNNTSSGISMTATIPTLRKFVYVHAIDVLGDVSAATIRLTAANGESAAVDTGEDGWCTFTGVPKGSYTIQITKEGYQTATFPGQTQESYPAQYCIEYLDRNQDFSGMTGADRDNDLLANADEPFYGTDPDKADSDGDGVIDGKDLSPLTNPINPTSEYLQKVGMIRFDQAIGMHGLDGKVEIWDMDLDILALSDDLEYSYTDQYNGTRKSTMDVTNYRKAVDKAFESEQFKSYAIRDISASDAGAGEDFPELVNDSRPDDNYIFEADHTHRTEYRFYYDYLVDYQMVSLKNTGEIFYPNKDNFFSYLLMPVKVRPGLQHTFSFQFTQPGLSDQIFFEDDTYYHELGFEYTFYNTNNFDDDNNALAPTYISLADCDGSDLFQFSIVLTAEQATRSEYYLKITPVWVHKQNNTTTMSPVNLNWNLTGLTREVLFSQSANGSKSIRESLTSIDSFNTEVMTFETAMAFSTNISTQNNTHVRQITASTLTVDPDAAADKRYQLMEMQLTVLSYIGSGTAGLKSTFFAAETFNIIRYNGKTMEDFPADSIFRTANYKNVTAGLDVARSLVSIYTNGTQAWKAYQEGERILCAYYAVKAGAAAGQAANALAKISLNVVATTSKTGRIARLASKEVGIGLSLVIGVIEITYNVYKYNTTEDPIQKVAYAEKTCAAEIDLGLGIIMAVYPPFIAFQGTWLIVHEGYGFIFGRDKMAYELTTSVGTVATFIIGIWTEQIPSQYAEKAYRNIVNVLFERFRVINLKNYPFVPVFVDPMQ